MMHVDDRDKILLAIQESYKNISELNVEFRVPSLDGRRVSWYWAQAKAEKKENGNVMWYGMFQDITNRKSYVDTLEQIAFDISHVLRRPIATMLGLTSIIQREELTKKQFLEYVEHIKTVSQEMDSFTRRLNQVYNAKRDNVHI